MSGLATYEGKTLEEVAEARGDCSPDDVRAARVSFSLDPETGLYSEPQAQDEYTDQANGHDADAVPKTEWEQSRGAKIAEGKEWWKGDALPQIESVFTR